MTMKFDENDRDYKIVRWINKQIHFPNFKRTRTLGHNCISNSEEEKS